MFVLQLTLRAGREDRGEWPDYREVDMVTQVERAEDVTDELGFPRDLDWVEDLGRRLRRHGR